MTNERLEELRTQIAETEADIACAEDALPKMRDRLIDLKIELAEV